jgi:hypothetical protein
MKSKTNEKALSDLMKELKGTIHTALIRERLLTISTITRAWAEEEIEKENETNNRSLINPSLYIDLCNRIDKNLSFHD